MNTPRPDFMGAIATPHTLATDTAEAIFREGGSAVDAAIAAAAVLSVVYPHNVSIGGDLIAIMRTGDGDAVCINASGAAPAGQSAERLRGLYGESLPVTGIDTITTPGAISGWGELHGRGGRLPWSRLFTEAIILAEDGVPVAPDLAANLVVDAERLRHDRGASEIFVPGGVPLGLGDLLVQPALGRTLSRIRDGGPAEFYSGTTADLLVAGLHALGGVHTGADLALMTPEVAPPLRGDFRGLEVVTSPPNTQGFALLRMLSAIEREQSGSAPLTRDAGATVRAFLSANTVRDALLSDPRFSGIHSADLLSAGPDLPGAPAGYGGWDYQRPRGDTVGIAVTDADGMSVSLIQSVFHAFGSAIIEPSTGILLHNRGTSFSLDHASPTVIAPGKRPPHTLMPVIVVENDDVRFVLATQGGQGQPQIHAQILITLLEGGTAAEAVCAPRFIVGVREYGASADTVFVESDVPAATMASLTSSGLPLFVTPPLSDLMGQANIIDLTGGMIDAASDPRADGSGIVVSRGPTLASSSASVG